MKKRLLAALCAASLLLSGCASLLDREYVDVTPHNTAPTAEGDPSILRAENYQELVNALLYFITTGVETGSVRLYVDSEDVEADLEAACLEVVQEDPLGAYAVDFIKYSVTPVVTYYEADIQVTYRRTREQVASIASATGTTAIRSELEEALDTFAPEAVLRIGYFDGDEDYIRALFLEAYCANPAAALDMPEVTVTIYPDSGRQRIVELLMNYHLEQEELERRREALSERALELSLELEDEEGDALLLDAAQAVLEAGGYAPERGSTAYHALLEGGADSQGMALAVSLLCKELDIGCYVAAGETDGESHFWNVVSTESGWRHLDLTRPDDPEIGPFLTDAQLEASGYVWNTERLPRCGLPEEDQAAAFQPEISEITP